MGLENFPKVMLHKASPLADQIFDFLKQMIIENKLEPLEQISENDLAKHFDVSRMPVRKALDRLNQIGLVEIEPKKCSFVQKISVQNINDICFIRVAIECESVRHIAELSNTSFNKVIAKLDKNIKAQQNLIAKNKPNSADNFQFLKLDDDFHALLCSFSETNLAWENINNLKANMDRIRYFTIAGSISSLEDLVAEHTAILNSIKEKQLDKACVLLHKHLFEIGKTYKIVKNSKADWFL